jgi:hypothetical protein
MGPKILSNYKHCFENPPLTTRTHTLGRCGGIRTREDKCQVRLMQIN